MHASGLSLPLYAYSYLDKLFITRIKHWDDEITMKAHNKTMAI